MDRMKLKKEPEAVGAIVDAGLSSKAVDRHCRQFSRGFWET